MGLLDRSRAVSNREKVNTDIRRKAKDAGVLLWQIADYFGMADASFSKILRKELAPEDKADILKAIEEIKSANQRED